MKENLWLVSYISKSGEHLDMFVSADINKSKHQVWDTFSIREEVLLVKLVAETDKKPKKYITL